MTRTTVVLEETLVRKIKEMALKNQKTFKDTMAELLEMGMKFRKTQPKKKKIALNTFMGGESTVPIHDRNALFSRMGERL